MLLLHDSGPGPLDALVELRWMRGEGQLRVDEDDEASAVLLARIH